MGTHLNALDALKLAKDNPDIRLAPEGRAGYPFLYTNDSGDVALCGFHSDARSMGFGLMMNNDGEPIEWEIVPTDTQP